MGGNYVVEVDVDASEVGEHKITDCVGPLNGVVVAVKGVEEPRIFRGYETPRSGVSP